MIDDVYVGFVMFVLFLIAVVVIGVIISQRTGVFVRRRGRYYRNLSVQERGIEGEWAVRSIIGYTVEGEQYVCNDYVFKVGDETVQIDHIVVNAYGVFVIETKNYSGQIYGYESSHEWTQVLAYGNEKNKLYNPIRQNAGHVYKLKQILGDVPFRSVVVFVQGNTVNIKSDKVISLNQLKSTLSQGEKVLNAEQMKKIYDLLVKEDKSREISKKAHVENIHERQIKIENNICPHCNKELVFKKGKYGDFWGCPNYPTCKFTKKK